MVRFVQQLSREREELGFVSSNIRLGYTTTTISREISPDALADARYGTALRDALTS